MKKLLSWITCCAVIIMCFQTLAFASDSSNDSIMPYYNNVNEPRAYFGIDSAGVATVDLSYIGYQGITTGATITTKIQKRFLLVFWQDVDIGMPDNYWIDESTGYYYATSHSVSLSKKGTYRAKVEFCIYGTGGEADIIELEREAEY